MNWVLGEVHPTYGVVVMMSVIQGEPYRFFRDDHGTTSMIPLDTLQMENE